MPRVRVRPDVIPAWAATLAFARRVLPPGPILLLHADALEPPFPAATGPGAAGALAPMLTRHAPLIPTLMRLHDDLAPGAVAVVSDLVWNTAPTPELIRAFAPAPGREKVRPIEGFEMQAEHAGFALQERLDVPRPEWVPSLPDAQRSAVEADARGAAHLCVWALRREG